VQRGFQRREIAVDDGLDCRFERVNGAVLGHRSDMGGKRGPIQEAVVACERKARASLGVRAASRISEAGIDFRRQVIFSSRNRGWLP
jgi:hypothetical protein